jgi:hypothetical protein
MSSTDTYTLTARKENLELAVSLLQDSSKRMVEAVNKQIENDLAVSVTSMSSILCDSRCRFFSLELQQLVVSSFISFPMSTNKTVTRQFQTYGGSSE